MAASKKTFEELKWIEEEAHAKRPPIDEFPLVGQRTFKTTILKKVGDNIFVPLGLLATTACLTLGLVNMKRGDSQRQQLFMRGRVLFQGLTIAAMTITLLMTARRNQPSKETTNDK